MFHEMKKVASVAGAEHGGKHWLIFGSPLPNV